MYRSHKAFCTVSHSDTEKKTLINQLINQLQSSFKVCYEPTDENKASKPFLSDSWKALTYISPNLQELKAINRTLGNPLPAGIEHSEESVMLTLLISHNLDQERAFSSPSPMSVTLAYNTVGIRKQSSCLPPFSHLCVGRSAQARLMIDQGAQRA